MAVVTGRHRTPTLIPESVREFVVTMAWSFANTGLIALFVAVAVGVL
jgi:hypothetical protein